MITVCQSPRTLLPAALALLLAGCAGSPTAEEEPSKTSDETAALAACPALPNCVRSGASNPVNAIAPLSIAGEASEVWAALLDHLEGDPQYTIVEQRDDYVRVEARTRIIGFIDDVEFQLRRDSGEIAVRSASRIGLFDLGANRMRIEGVRRALDGQ